MNRFLPVVVVLAGITGGLWTAWAAPEEQAALAQVIAPNPPTDGASVDITIDVQEPGSGEMGVSMVWQGLPVGTVKFKNGARPEEIAVTATQLFTALQAAKHAVFKKSDTRRRSLIVNPAIRELLVEAEEVLKSLRPEAVSAVATADAPARRRADSDDEAED